MLDSILRRRSETVLAPLAGRLAGWRIRANALTLAACVLGVGALFAVGHRYYLTGLAVLALAGVLDALDGPVARREGTTAAGAALDRVLGLVLCGAIPFAFALAKPDRALAAMFLMLSLVARAGAMPVEAAGSEPLVGKSELLIAVAAACVFPQWFSLIAYIVGILCFVSAGRQLAAAFAGSRS